LIFLSQLKIKESTESRIQKTAANKKDCSYSDPNQKRIAVVSVTGSCLLVIL